MTLQQIQNIDIRDIDPNTVVNADDVLINTELPQIERMKDVVAQMNGNPYFFKTGKILVKMSFMETDICINKRWEDHLRTV
jgi:hypothetical protein